MPVSCFLDLPPDVMAHCLGHIRSPFSLLAASCTCKYLHHITSLPEPWVALLWHHHEQVLKTLFFGRIPPPPTTNFGFSLHDGCPSWKYHYFDFAGSWKRQAQHQTGRLLLKIRSSAVRSGRSYAEALPEDTFGVYDATAYAPQHPGLDQILIDAAEDEDSTESFEVAAHSHVAKSILRSLAIPGLEALPVEMHRGDACPMELARRRQSMRRRRWLQWIRQGKQMRKIGLKMLCPVVVSIIALLQAVMPGCEQISFGDGGNRSDGDHDISLEGSGRVALHVCQSLDSFLRVVLTPVRGSLPSRPWMAACTAVFLAVREASWQVVATLAASILIVALRLGAVGEIRNFFHELFGSPLAALVLTLVPSSIAIFKACRQVLSEGTDPLRAGPTAGLVPGE